MAENTNTTTEVVDVKANYEEALSGIAKFNREIELLQAHQAKLKEELKKGAINSTEYGQAMARAKVDIISAKDSVRLLEKEIRNNIKIEREQEGSLKQLEARLSKATAEYRNMSKAVRESAEGKDLARSINEITTELSKAEQGIQLFYRNVGNYKESITSALAGNNQFAASILQTAASAGTAGGAFKALGSQVAAFGKTLMSLLMNPIVLMIAAIVAVVVSLSKAFSTNEENTNKLSIVMSKISSVFSYLLKVLEPIAGFIFDVLIKSFEQLTAIAETALTVLSNTLGALGFDKASKAVSDFTSGLKEQSKAATDLVKTQQLLIKLNREQVTRNAEIESALQNVTNAMNKEGISTSEKIKLLKQEAELNKEKARMALKIALATKQAAELEIQVHGRTKEALDALAQATAGVTLATAALGEAYHKENANIAAANKEAIAKAKERSEAELKAHRDLEDSLLRLLKDEGAKQIAATEQNYNRQIEDLKKRLKEEKNLTEKARKDINATIVNLEKERDNATADLWEKFSSDALKKQADIELTNLNNRLAAIKTEGEESLKLRLDILTRQHDAEIREAEKTGIDVAAIRAKYAKLAADEEKKINDAALNQAKSERELKLQNDIAALQLANKQTFDVRIAAKQKEIDSLQQKEGESDAMFLERTRSLNIEIAALQKERTDYAKAQMEANVLATANMFGAFSDLLEQFAEQNEAMAVFSKATALFEILLSTGVAISKGIAAAQAAGPFPANIAAIATTVAAIVSGIASATQIVKKAKEPTATGTSSVSSGGSVSYFSEGGLVDGPGTGTSDSVPAMLSNGEYVMTARATNMFAPLLSALNQIGAGVPISTSGALGQAYDTTAIGKIIAKEMGNMPTPVVRVTEINNVQNRVKVLESDATV